MPLNVALDPPEGGNSGFNQFSLKTFVKKKALTMTLVGDVTARLYYDEHSVKLHSIPLIDLYIIHVIKLH